MANPVRALFIHPRFLSASFWNYFAACELTGAKSPSPPLGLMTVAAMLPDHWEARLVDCNVRELTDTDLSRADVVFIGAMLPQQYDAIELIERCKAYGLPTVVGGPDPTSARANYACADMLVLGEVEGVMDEFIAAFESGQRTGLWEAEKFTADVTKTPIPRYDLIQFSDYLDMSVQFSRGCPFLCEFCDIIELYGRKPRTKTIDQTLAELQSIYDLGHRGVVQFVDDNLIGNKKAAKTFLPHLVEWQKARGYPFEFATEASLNLADDTEFLALLRDACFVGVFIGIESPDPEVLIAARKKQNIERDVAANIRRINSYGIFVLAGFIIGMDNEKDGAGAAIIDLIEECAIPVAMTGLLFALPNTQLSRRLEREDRILPDFATDTKGDLSDQCTAGLNFETLRPKADVLRDYQEVVRRTFNTEAFFARTAKNIRQIDGSGPNGKMHRSRAWNDIKNLCRMLWIVSFRYPKIRGPMWRLILKTARTNPDALKHATYQAGLFVHLGPFSEHVVKLMDVRIAEVEREALMEAQVPPLAIPPAEVASAAQTVVVAE